MEYFTINGKEFAKFSDKEIIAYLENIESGMMEGTTDKYAMQAVIESCKVNLPKTLKIEKPLDK